MGELEGIYESTGICPYTDVCDTFLIIVDCEGWMSRAVSTLRQEGKESLPPEEGGYSVEMLYTKLVHMREIREDRCCNSNRRCLRYWQFERKRRDKEILEGREKLLLQTSSASPAVGTA